MIKRRAFIAGLGSAAAWPLVARAQQSERLRRVAVLMAHKEDDPEYQNYLGAFRQGLLKLGWIEGQNVRIDARWGALDDADQRQHSAKELLALQPDIILTQNTPPTASMLQQTRIVPVVLWLLPTRLGVALLAVWRIRAVTLPALPSRSRQKSFCTGGQKFCGL